MNSQGSRRGRSRRGMLRVAGVALAALLGLSASGCEEVGTTWSGAGPPPPEDLEVWYYAGSVNLEWFLHPDWDGEAFRVYGKRSSDPDYFLVAEVSNCRDEACSYTDINVSAGRSYEYYVASVDLRDGSETASEFAIEVFVPEPVAPPMPGEVDAVPLDDAIYLTWDRSARSADDFSFYRVYLEGGDGSVVFLGETDSEGFVDLLVENGNTYGYFVTSVDDQGHESDGSLLAEGTPRPDFRGEYLYAWEDRPALAGFRFQETEGTDPVVPGSSGDRHFRLEIDSEGWWMVPGPGVQLHGEAIPTSALRCGPAADAGCTDLRTAPQSGYQSGDLALLPGHSYVLRVPAGGGGWRYGVIRIVHVGFAQDGAIAIFDWAFQLQIDNPALSRIAGEPSPHLEGSSGF